MPQMELDRDGTQPSTSEVMEIINKYIEFYILMLNNEKEKLSLRESYTTYTKIVPKDFFDDGSIDYCGTENTLFKEFGNPIVLFNDLKNSTKILKETETAKQECVYIAYMQYSSQMLAEILDLINGNMIECTGDGNYSILFEEKIDRLYIRELIEDFMTANKEIITTEKFKNYLNGFNEDEIFFIKERTSFLAFIDPRYSSVLRSFFFKIFATFNILINQRLPIRYQFYTRIGCVQGKCKITRIKIDKHIFQDKLIGSVVHAAAHQAGGK